MCDFRVTRNYDYVALSKNVDHALDKQRLETRAYAEIEARVRAEMLARMQAQVGFPLPIDT